MVKMSISLSLASIKRDHFCRVTASSSQGVMRGSRGQEQVGQEEVPASP